MKRDQRLYPLSWGHHRALLFAWRLSRTLEAAGAQPQGADRETAEKLRAFWAAEMEPHLRAEEEVLFPAAESVPAVEAALQEHRQRKGSAPYMRPSPLARARNGPPPNPPTPSSPPGVAPVL